MASKLTTFKDDILERYENGETTEQIGKVYNCSYVTVYRFLKSLNIDTCPYVLAPHTETVIELYQNGIGMKEIAKKYKCSIPAVCMLLERNNINARQGGLKRYSVDSTFFDIIDTEHKAYALGFWYADGYNNRRNNTITLGITDKDILLILAETMKYTGPIRTYTSGKIGTDGTPHKDIHHLSITDARLSTALENNGCGQAKTFTVKFPYDYVPEPLLIHFVRGYFDGDGCVSYGGEKLSVCFVGNNEFCTDLAKYLSTIVSGKPINSKPIKNKPVSQISISGKFKAREIMERLYQDATIFLPRKNEKYKNSIKIIDEKNKPILV